jgi:hypothetical protein
VCLIVLAGTHGVATIPHLFTGNLEDAWIEHVLASLEPTVAGAAELRTGLYRLRELAGQGVRWPRLFAVAGDGSVDDWLDLAHATVASLDSGVPTAPRERLADLAWWCTSAVAALAPDRSFEADDVEALVRCQLLAGQIAAAGGGILALAQAGADPEAAIELLGGFTDGAIRGACEAQAGDWLEANLVALDAALGTPYDTAQALFRLRAASAAPLEALLAAADRLAKRNRKLMRQDLTREPIWAVRPELAGDLLDTATAAQVLGRSPTFVAKRLEAGTIPLTRQDGQLRIPAGALAAWKTVLDRHGLLDGGS